MDVRTVTNAAGDIVRVALRLLRDGRVEESFEDLQVSSGTADDLFEVINGRSRFVVALEPGFTNASPPRTRTRSPRRAHRLTYRKAVAQDA